MSLKVACVGTSFITVDTIKAIAQTVGVEAYAIYSRNLKKAESFGLQKAYDDYSKMLSDSEVDIVYIASPNTLHYIQAKEALQAGKHVVLEKPFVQTLSEAEELFQLAEDNACLLFEAITTIHSHSYKQIKEQLPKLGKITHFYANYSQYSSRYDKYLAGEVTNIFNPDFAGGALGDLNIYNLHLAIGLFGKPLTCKYYPNRGFNRVDTSGLVVLHYPGFTALCFGAKDSNGVNGFELQGEKAHIYSKEDTRYPAKIETNIEDFPATPQLVERLKHEWQDFARTLHSGKLSEYNEWKAHTLAVMEVYEALKAEL